MSSADRPPPTDPGEELVEWVDVDGSVIDVVPRRRVRAEVLRHRCTYVVVLTGADELVVHQRADWKDVYPSYWDICFGGITGVGEQWEDAARRELAEEAGIEGTDLVPLGPVHYDAEDGRIVGRAFVTRHDGVLDCPDGEVVAVDRVPRAELAHWLQDRPVCPDSRQLVLPLLQAHWNAHASGAGS
ncbi:MAG: NUDIX domain-containing protein [Actinomycetota bacterium]